MCTFVSLLDMLGLWPYGCQSDMLGLWPYGCQSDMLGFVVHDLSVEGIIIIFVVWMDCILF